MSLPLIGAGLDLDERVVRRHISKLETAGWLVREPWVWGEGSVVVLTRAGLDGVELKHVRPVRTPVKQLAIIKGLDVASTAARFERRGYEWRSVRELEDGKRRCGVPARTDRGPTRLVPDLLVRDEARDRQIAVVIEKPIRREDREKKILKGWRDALVNGLYDGVQFECGTEFGVELVSRMAQKVGLTPGLGFAAHVREDAAGIRQLL